MANINVNEISATVKSALADYTRIIFASEVELDNLRQSKKALSASLEAVKATEILGDDIPDGSSSLDWEKKISAVDERIKAVRAYQTEKIFGVHKKSAPEVSGIADFFGLDDLYEFAITHASSNGEINGYVDRISGKVREMFPEETRAALINKFSRSLAVKVGTSDPTRGKKILKGIVAEDINYKKYVLSFLSNFAQKMSVTEKTGVRLYNIEGYGANTVYNFETGKPVVESMTVFALEDDFDKIEESED